MLDRGAARRRPRRPAKPERRRDGRRSCRCRARRVRQAHRGKTIVLCHGAFDLVHMGHVHPLRGGRLARRLARRDDHGRPVHHEEALGVVQRRVPAAAGGGARDRRLRRPRQRAVGRRGHRGAAARMSTSRARSTRTWCSTRPRTSSARSSLSRATAAASTSRPAKRSPPRSCRTSCRRRRRPSRTTPCSATNACLFRDVSTLVQARRDEGLSRGRQRSCGSACLARRSSTSGWTSPSPTCRRSRGAWPARRPRGSARSAAPASSRCTWPSFVHEVHCFTNGCLATAGEHHV